MLTTVHSHSLTLHHSCHILILVLHSCHILILVLHSCHSVIFILHSCHSGILVLHSCLSIISLHSCHSLILALHSRHSLILVLHSCNSIILVLYSCHSLILVLHSCHSLIIVLHSCHSLILLCCIFNAYTIQLHMLCTMILAVTSFVMRTCGVWKWTQFQNQFFSIYHWSTMLLIAANVIHIYAIYLLKSQESAWYNLQNNFIHLILWFQTFLE